MLVFILSCAVAVVVSFFCSMAEAILLSLNPVRLETLGKEGKAYAKAWLDLKKNVDRPIAAILILNTVAHTGGATVAGAAFDATWGDQYIWIFSLVFTVVVLFGTEIIPKVLGVNFSGVLAPIFLKPLQFSIAVFRPIIFVTERVSQTLRGAKPMGTELEAADLITLARLARARALIDPSQESIIIKATKLRKTTAADAMLPIDRIKYFRLDRSTEENLDYARQYLHTRYPVSRSDSVADIVGYANFKEIFAVDPEERAQSLFPYLRENILVGKDLALSDVMKLLIAKKRHLALVTNSAGEIVGMLTLEDVLEEIVGEIEEEYAPAGPEQT